MKSLSRLSDQPNRTAELNAKTDFAAPKEECLPKLTVYAMKAKRHWSGLAMRRKGHLLLLRSKD